MDTLNNTSTNMNSGEKKNPVLVVVILAGILVLGVIGYKFLMGGYSANASSNPQGYGQTNTVTPSAPNTPTQTTSNEIAISNFAFNPGSLTVPVGTTVTWTNNDSVTHSVKSGTFSSPALAPGDTFQQTFNTAGTFKYSCSIHPSMTGTIIVQ